MSRLMERIRHKYKIINLIEVHVHSRLYFIDFIFDFIELNSS